MTGTWQRRARLEKVAVFPGKQPRELLVAIVCDWWDHLPHSWQFLVAQAAQVSHEKRPRLDFSSFSRAADLAETLLFWRGVDWHPDPGPLYCESGQRWQRLGVCGNQQQPNGRSYAERTVGCPGKRSGSRSVRKPFRSVPRTEGDREVALPSSNESGYTCPCELHLVLDISAPSCHVGDRETRKKGILARGTPPLTEHIAE